MAVYSARLTRWLRNSREVSGSTAKKGRKSKVTPYFSVTAWYGVRTRGVFWDTRIFLTAISFALLSNLQEEGRCDQQAGRQHFEGAKVQKNLQRAANH